MPQPKTVREVRALIPGDVYERVKRTSAQNRMALAELVGKLVLQGVGVSDKYHREGK